MKKMKTMKNTSSILFKNVNKATYLNWLEKLAHNEKVAGSSPVVATPYQMV